MRKLIPVLVILCWPALLLTGSTLTPHVTKPEPAATPCPSCPAGNLNTFDMKTGLWRIDMTSDMSGLSQMTPAALAHATPQQRALFAAMAKGQGPRTIAYTSCVTESELHHSDHFTLGDGNETWTCAKDDATTIDAKTVLAEGDCTSKKDGMRMSGKGTFHLVDRQDFTASGKLKMYQAGEAEPYLTNQISMKGTWVEASCPATPQAPLQH
ncbi:MAG: DUF3617 family protein [Thermoanaerobaculaceae bacterium]|nr:DUF3617 family protein [Thermoanaerobaculaceae bacterium]